MENTRGFCYAQGLTFLLSGPLKGKESHWEKHLHTLYKVLLSRVFSLKVEKINPQENFNSITKKTFYLILYFGNSNSSN